MRCSGRACALSSLGDLVCGGTRGSLPLPPFLSLSSLYFYSLKLECEKLATEKTEIQRHYVMVSELHLNERRAAVGGVSSEPSKNTRPWDALASPWYGLCGQALRSASCGCHCLVFPQKELWCLSRACCHRSRCRGDGRAAAVWLVSFPGRTVSVLRAAAMYWRASAPRRGAGGRVLLAWL